MLDEDVFMLDEDVFMLGLLTGSILTSIIFLVIRLALN